MQGTAQYLWKYGIGAMDTGLAVTFDLRAYGVCAFLKQAHTEPLLVFNQLRRQLVISYR